MIVYDKMEHQEIVDNWNHFFSSMTKMVAEMQLRESTESFTVADSILTKLNGSIEANIRIKDHIMRRANEEYIDEGNIRLLLSLLDNFIQYLNSLWKRKIDLISMQSAFTSLSDFISYRPGGLPGRP